MRRVLLFVSVLTLVACGEAAIMGGQGGGTGTGGGTGAGGGAGGAGGGGAGAITDLPCDVATLLATRCASCHGNPLSGSAPYPLLSRADLMELAPGFAGQTKADRCVVRMQAMVSAMPPAPAAPVPSTEIAALQAWIAGGMQPGSCAGIDAGLPPLVCTSNSRWTDGNDGDFDMNPGWACQSCHRGLNFNGQNPTGDDKPGEAWFFMGTVYPSLTEEDRCSGRPAPTVRVEILGPDGGVIVTMVPSANSGNFGSGGPQWGATRRLMWNQNVALPYTARVTNGANVLEMQTPQTNGDCNSCHTERGLNGAQGRIVFPPFGMGSDAGSDAGTTVDAGSDAGTTVDAGSDGGSDAGAAVDAGTDAGALDPDAGTDAGTIDPDAGSDAGTIDPDAGVDGGDPDAGTDGG